MEKERKIILNKIIKSKVVKNVRKKNKEVYFI